MSIRGGNRWTRQWRELYQSLERRRRPEEIAGLVRQALGGGVDRETERALRAVARHARPAGWSSMTEEFARPVGMGRQIAKASELFRTLERPDDLNVVAIREYLETIRLYRIARLLRRTWKRSNVNRQTMIVRRGNDSSTWNITAGAWNRAREGWIAVVYALGMEELLERQCPGKALRLMAADVAAWHRAAGGQLDPDTRVLAELPLPWVVLAGEADCPRAQVEAVCRRYGADPEKSGWTAPRPGRTVSAFRPTPELVHGVVVASPELAGLLRKAGWFSGQARAQAVDADVIVHRDAHGFALGAEEGSRG